MRNKTKERFVPNGKAKEHIAYIANKTGLHKGTVADLLETGWTYRETIGGLYFMKESRHV